MRSSAQRGRRHALLNVREGHDRAHIHISTTDRTTCPGRLTARRHVRPGLVKAQRQGDPGSGSGSPVRPRATGRLVDPASVNPCSTSHAVDNGDGLYSTRPGQLSEPRGMGILCAPPLTELLKPEALGRAATYGYFRLTCASNWMSRPRSAVSSDLPGSGTAAPGGSS
jgi:hypothetical protein